MECFDVKPREMGSETFYGSTDVLCCPNCDNEITFETFVNHYASSWFCEFECDRAELVQVNGLLDLLEELGSCNSELKKLKSESGDLQRRLELLVEKAQKTNGYILIVEGDDDEEVWNRLLLREGVDVARVNIAKYGDGGLDSAIKAAKYFKGRILKTIPHKLIVDSDNRGDERRIRLKKAGIRNFHILSKKEIESYLLEPKALSQILNADLRTIRQELHKTRKHGKEELDRLFMQIMGKKATPSAKALIAGALEKVPPEMDRIIREIKAAIYELDKILQESEDYEY
jgi:5S rRNA maturation endonuclease (ribonuclease M5)